MNLSKDMIYYAFIKGIGVLYWVILIKLSSNYLTPEDFGNFSITFSVSTVVAILWTGWQSASLVRYYHENNKIIFYEVLSKGIFKNLIYLCIVWFFVFLLLYLSNSFSNSTIVFLVLPLGVVYGIHLFIVNKLRIKRELKKLLLLNVFQALIIIFGFLALVEYFSWKAAVIAFILAYTASLFLVRGKMLTTKVNTLSNNKELKEKFINYGLPVVSIGIISQLLSASDLLILKFYGYTYEVGIYSANYNIAEKSIFALLTIMTSAFTPILYKKSTISDFNLRKEITKVVTVFLIISLPILAIIWTYSLEISNIFLEKRYTSGFFIIPLVSIAGIFMGVASFFSESLTLAEKTKQLAYLYSVALIVNILLNIIFIKDYGMIAAVYSTVASYFILMGLIYLRSLKYFRI